MKLFHSISGLIFFLITCYLSAQTLPPIQVFTPEDYGADNQNWMICQAENGYIYSANNKGLLEFNGAEWQIYPSPNNTIIRTVNVIGDKIYTGCYMEFGYWTKNNLGKLEYSSLVPKLDKKMLEDEQIWTILPHNEWVIFQSNSNIYFYNTETEKFKKISSDEFIFRVFKIQNTIYYHVPSEGIYKIEKGESKLAYDDVIIKNKKIISFFDVDGTLFFLTRTSGFFKLENNKIVPWQISINDLLKTINAFSGIKLADGNFILGTISNGIINLSPKGEINYQITQKNGLGNNTALALFEDRDKNLWVGLDNGINCVNITSPIKTFHDYDGVVGTVYVSKVFKEHLYLGTNQGLFYKKLDSDGSFEFIEGTTGQVWNLHDYKGENLLCGHHLGTYVIDGDKAILIDDNLGAWDFKTIPKQEGLLLRGNYEGLFIMHKNNGVWKVRNKIEGFDISSRFFEITSSNQVWINHEYKGVFRLKLNDSLTRILKVDMESDLPIGKSSSLIKYKETILYAHENGIFKYNSSIGSFKKDSTLSLLINPDNYTSGKLVNDKKERVWGFSKENINYAFIDDLTNSPKINAISIPSNLRKSIIGFENISLISDETYLLGTVDGFTTIDLSKIAYDKEYTVNLNSVGLKDRDDMEFEYIIDEQGEFTHKPGIITFNYSVPEYNKYLNVEYQYRLVGHNDKWSEWANDASVDFENLSFGNYTFKVRAKIGNKPSQNVSSYNFTIDRPWFLSNMALFVYFLSLIVIAFATNGAYRRYYNKKLERKQSENEKLIMRIKNEQLNQDIESKNRELTISKMSIIKKNELLNAIKKELNNNEHPKNINSVIRLIDKNLNSSKDWDFFVKAFNNTDKGFMDKMKRLHPNLTSNDQRLCVFLRLNMSSKEIAPLLNISVKSVETKRYRLRKRLNLPHEENLVDYILNV